MKDMISARAIRNIALVGISKNAGKTTLLNGILRAHPEFSWAVLSTGIDGETEDRVYKTPKPQVQLPPGCLFCCDATWLGFHGSAVTILTSKEYAGRLLYIARAEAFLDTQITGPSSVLHQNDVIRLMHRLGAKKVLIDGSLDRKSIALEDTIDMLILSVGASFGSTEQIIGELERLISLRDIPVADLSKDERGRLKQSQTIMLKKKGRWRDTGISSLIRHEKMLIKLLELHPESLYLPTSLTDTVFEKLIKAFSEPRLNLLFRHPECIKLSPALLSKLFGSCAISCLIPFKIRAFVLNSTAVGKDPVPADSFRSIIREAFPQETFIDLLELV